MEKSIIKLLCNLQSMKNLKYEIQITIGNLISCRASLSGWPCVLIEVVYYIDFWDIDFDEKASIFIVLKMSSVRALESCPPIVPNFGFSRYINILHENFKPIFGKDSVFSPLGPPRGLQSRGFCFDQRNCRLIF